MITLSGAQVETARRRVAEAGLQGRVEVRHADANQLDAEDAYAAVTLNITLHECGSGPEQYLNVLRRVRRALTPGGAVIVSELPYPDSPRAYRESPVYRGLAGVGIHEALVGCGMITQGELRRLLAEAGFADARVAEQPLPTRFVMIGEK
jgi:cyclopropane fatty-acyl-phospholipid synthase-like methyltransferase